MKKLGHMVLFLIVGLLVSAPAMATAINRDQANEYYARCAAQVTDSSDMKSVTTMCACTSAGVMSLMSYEELNSMNESTAEGTAARHKFLVEVYAPCSEIVAADLINYECSNNDELFELNKDFDIIEICRCSAEQTAYWYKGKGKEVMTALIKADPLLPDPVAAILAYPPLKSQSRSNMVACSAVPKDEKSGSQDDAQ